MQSKLILGSMSQCKNGEKLSFIRWSGVTPERSSPVFVYSASGEEQSLVGVCLSRCKELADCAAVVVEYGKGSCHGMNSATGKLHVDNDVAYFSKICVKCMYICFVPADSNCNIQNILAIFLSREINEWRNIYAN